MEPILVDVSHLVMFGERLRPLASSPEKTKAVWFHFFLLSITLNLS